MKRKFKIGKRHKPGRWHIKREQISRLITLPFNHPPPPPPRHRAVFNWVTNKKNQRTKVYVIIGQWELKVKTNKLLKARENADDQVAIVFSFASDWLRGWHEFSGPITEQGWVKPKWSWISLYTHSKIVLASMMSI